MHKEVSLRIRIISGCVLFFAVLLIIRLYYLQIRDASFYRDKAERQYVHTTTDLYSRGSIFFTTKDGDHVSAASIKSGYVIAVNPTMIHDAMAVYNQLSGLILMDSATFTNLASQANRTYVEIQTDLDSTTADTIAALKIPGVMLYRNQWRYYPGNEVAARAIGFIGYSKSDPNTLHGIYGLERYYDDILTYDDTVLSVNFFAEIFSNLGDLVFDTKTSKTGSVVTTVEPTVARMLDKVLVMTHDHYQSKLTGGIIMNPKTGEIYAMSTVPTYNLNKRGEATVADFQNPLVENVYEFGSIVKALTMASGLDSGAVTTATTYNDTGSLTLNGSKISNYDGRARGVIPMQEVLSQSLNVGATFVMEKMSKPTFKTYFTNLKLGSETGIDLPNEAKGLMDNLDSPRDIEYATASYGQGIAFTPMEMTRALAALGNGGYLVTPHLVSKIEYQDKTSKDVNYPLGTQVFKTSTSETISRMLTTVADHALKNGAVRIEHHSFAAKTGTAQMADPQTGKYYENKYLHSFFGYFPSYDPKFIIFLYTVDPQGVQYASGTLTDPFIELTQFLINYYNIPPDR